MRDGVFDPNAVSGQIGAMALLRRLIDMVGINVPAEDDVPLPDTPSPPSEADLAKQPYPGVAVRLNHPGPHRRHAAAAAAQSARLLVQDRRQG